MRLKKLLKGFFAVLFILLQNDLLSSEQPNLTSDSDFGIQINLAKERNQDYTGLLKKVINGYEGTKDSDYPMFSKNFATQSYLDLAELTFKKAMEQSLIGYNKFDYFDKAKEYAQKNYPKHIIIAQIDKQILKIKELYSDFLKGEEFYNNENYNKAVVYLKQFINSLDSKKLKMLEDTYSVISDYMYYLKYVLHQEVFSSLHNTKNNLLENFDLLRIKSHQYIGLIYSEYRPGIKKNLNLAIEHLEIAAKYAQKKSDDIAASLSQIEFYGKIFQQIEALLCDLRPKKKMDSKVCVIQ